MAQDPVPDYSRRIWSSTWVSCALTRIRDGDRQGSSPEAQSVTGAKHPHEHIPFSQVDKVMSEGPGVDRSSRRGIRDVGPSTGALNQIGYRSGFFANFRSPHWYAQTFYAIMRQYGQNDIYIDGQRAADTEAAIQAEA